MAKPSTEQLLAAAKRRLELHMHAMDPTTVASAEMSAAKADGRFMNALEEVLRHAITTFNAGPLVARAWQQTGGGDADDPAAQT